MAELERTWAIASAHAEGVSIRKIAAAAGLGPTRVHANVRDAELDGLDAALGELRSLYGWPAPEDTEGSRDEELAGRELIAERLVDEVQWLRDCASWLEQLELGEYPPVVSLRPDADHPERCNIVVDLDRVRRVLLRIAADIDELARARTVEDLEHARVDPDVRAERRRRLAESPLAFPAHGRSLRQYRQALYEVREGALAPRGDRLAPARPRHLPAVEPGWRPGAAADGSAGVHQSERLTAVFCSITTRTPVDA